MNALEIFEIQLMRASQKYLLGERCDLVWSSGIIIERMRIQIWQAQFLRLIFSRLMRISLMKHVPESGEYAAGFSASDRARVRPDFAISMTRIQWRKRVDLGRFGRGATDGYLAKLSSFGGLYGRLRSATVFGVGQPNGVTCQPMEHL